VEVEVVVDGDVDTEKALRRSGRFEPLHLTLSAPHRLMRILRTVVCPQSLVMTTGQAKVAERRTVGGQLVGGQDLGDEALFPEQLTHQTPRRPLVASAPDQHVEDLTFMTMPARQPQL
jgi:hypothetical protein